MQKTHPAVDDEPHNGTATLLYERDQRACRGCPPGNPDKHDWPPQQQRAKDTPHLIKNDHGVGSVCSAVVGIAVIVACAYTMEKGSGERGNVLERTSPARVARLLHVDIFHENSEIRKPD